jgi:ubiquitin C
MYLQFITFEGTKFNIEIDENNTIENLKYKIQNEHNIPIDKQILIFRGGILDNSKQIINCNLDNNNTIHLIKLIEDNKCTIS